jgi:hypothetical protein
LIKIAHQNPDRFAFAQSQIADPGRKTTKAQGDPQLDLRPASKATRRSHDRVPKCAALRAFGVLLADFIPCARPSVMRFPAGPINGLALL